MVANLFEDVEGASQGEVFDSLVESGRLKIERIVSRGHTSPQSGWYDQEQNEWVVVLRGEAVIAFPDKPSLTLGEGDYLSIKAHEKHRVQWTDPERDTVWLAVHYQDQ